MRVLQVSAELFPLLKTGGLADVAGALPDALGRQGCEVRLLLPGLAALRDGLADLQPMAAFDAPWGERAVVQRGRWGPHPAYLVQAPGLYERPGGPYADDQGRPWADNHRRFGLLGLAAAALGVGLDPLWRPDVVHAHDWHAALAPAALHFERVRSGVAVGSVFTVHNLAYQGLFPAATFADLGLPPQAFQMQGLEFHGQVSFMKAGLQFADRLTTVSPSYAREVQTPEQGCGLDGLLRERGAVLSGILNGVDPAVWSPAQDPAIDRPYDAAHLGAKAANRRALQLAHGLAPHDDGLLFGIVSRITEQKGLRLVLDGLPALLAQGGQLVVLGTGDAPLVEALRAAARRHPGAVAVHVGYDEALSHRVFAGCDVVLVPSRFEPCGLTQLYGLAYGSLPLVHRVGGLADTVADASLENLTDGSATGFVFARFEQADFDAAVRRAFALRARPRSWRRLQRAAMDQRFDWDTAARAYLDVYRAAAPDT